MPDPPESPWGPILQASEGLSIEFVSTSFNRAQASPIGWLKLVGTTQLSRGTCPSRIGSPRRIRATRSGLTRCRWKLKFYFLFCCKRRRRCHALQRAGARSTTKRACDRTNCSLSRRFESEVVKRARLSASEFEGGDPRQQTHLHTRKLG